jgi:hypothetical protein
LRKPGQPPPHDLVGLEGRQLVVGPRDAGVGLAQHPLVARWVDKLSVMCSEARNHSDVIIRLAAGERG